MDSVVSRINCRHPTSLHYVSVGGQGLCPEGWLCASGPFLSYKEILAQPQWDHDVPPSFSLAWVPFNPPWLLLRAMLLMERFLGTMGDKDPTLEHLTHILISCCYFHLSEHRNNGDYDQLSSHCHLNLQAVLSRTGICVNISYVLGLSRFLQPRLASNLCQGIVNIYAGCSL